MTSKHFISYRREDTSAWAGHLCERLREAFGQSNVFMDIDTIRLGSDFVEAIYREIDSCDLVLVIMGKQWLAVGEGVGRRLDDELDFVRLEVTAALESGKRVIPIYVDGAESLLAADLPDPLVPLSRKQGEEIRNDKFYVDVAASISKIEKLPGFQIGGGPKSGRKGWWIFAAAAVTTIVLIGISYTN